MFDLEHVRRSWASCSGIENYSRHIVGSVTAGDSRPGTLLDFFPEDYLLDRR